MRRGAFPRDLTPQERKRIGEIYAEARRLTKQTGIEHHVDHIKPLASGGEHHPSNLRVITAEENLKKGAAWDGRPQVSETRRDRADFQGELSLGVYRNLGVGRKDDVS
jgi:5-methylcytosine-specific restriction endonuclease McrA